MLGIFKSWYRAKKASLDIQAAQSEAMAKALAPVSNAGDPWTIVAEQETITKEDLKSIGLKEDSNIINTRNEEGGWQLLGSAWKGHIAFDQQIMVMQARKFFRFNPMARAAIMGKMKYIMGKGLTLTPMASDPRVWYIWREFWTAPRNNMAIRQFEIVKRLLRDGEVFIRYFNKDGTSAKTWKTTIRFIDPMDLKRTADEGYNITDKTQQGIIFDENDAEKPLMYYMQDRINTGKFLEVPAAEIQHIKLHSDMDQARGESDIQPIMQLFTHYKSWMENRIILNKLRTAIVMVRETEVGSAATNSNLSASLPGSSRGAGANKKQNIQPGAIYSPPPGTKLKMESANINASDVKDDGRAMILQMAAGTGLPEYMFGDASNGNYASTMIAEAPFVKEIQYLQTFIEFAVWKEMFRRVLKNAVDAGKIKEPEDIDVFALYPDGKTLKEAAPGAAQSEDDAEGEEPEQDEEQYRHETPKEIFYGCDVEWPEIIHRDPKETADALSVLLSEGLISHQTASAVAGFEYGEEIRKEKAMLDEAEEDGNPLLKINPGDTSAAQEEADGLDNMSGEESDVVKQMTPEDRKQVLASKDPKEVMGIVQKYLNKGAKPNGKAPVGAAAGGKDA
jgi:hypothetical protein